MKEGEGKSLRLSFSTLPDCSASSACSAFKCKGPVEGAIPIFPSISRTYINDISLIQCAYGTIVVSEKRMRFFLLVDIKNLNHISYWLEDVTVGFCSVLLDYLFVFIACLFSNCGIYPLSICFQIMSSNNNLEYTYSCM